MMSRSCEEINKQIKKRDVRHDSLSTCECNRMKITLNFRKGSFFLEMSPEELVKELQVWCRREELDEDHAVMVEIPEDRENVQIEETMGNIKALGRVRVRGRTLSLKLNLLKVLCECKDVVDHTKVPPDLLPAGKTEKWRIIIASENPVPVRCFS